MTVVVSGGVSLALIALFQFEQTSGMRLLRSARVLFDRAVEQARNRIAASYRAVSGPALRASVHYLFHKLLSALLRSVARLEAKLHSIARSNKDRANRSVNSEGVTSASHLSAIADYKRETELSDSEKQERRDAALSGK